MDRMGGKTDRSDRELFRKYLWRDPTRRRHAVNPTGGSSAINIPPKAFYGRDTISLFACSDTSWEKAHEFDGPSPFRYSLIVSLA